MAIKIKGDAPKKKKPATKKKAAAKKTIAKKEPAKKKEVTKKKTKNKVVEQFLAQGKELFGDNNQQLGRYLYGVSKVEFQHSAENYQALIDKAESLLA